MRENGIWFLQDNLKNDQSFVPIFSVLEDNTPSDLAEDLYADLPTENHMSFIIKNWDELDCLNKKCDELREKEIDNIISDFERDLLQNLLEKRILEFPNPHLPSDHEEAMDAIQKFKSLERKFNKKRKNKKQKLGRLFSFFSWLS